MNFQEFMENASNVGGPHVDICYVREQINFRYRWIEDKDDNILASVEYRATPEGCYRIVALRTGDSRKRLIKPSVFLKMASRLREKKEDRGQAEDYWNS